MPARTFDQLATELSTIIGKARDAAARADRTALSEQHGALAGFIERLDARIPGAIALGDVASAAMRDVTLARLDQAVGRALTLRSTEIARITRMFSEAARE